eukprot:755494-Hanusia_phi.AAC.3
MSPVTHEGVTSCEEGEKEEGEGEGEGAGGGEEEERCDGRGEGSEGGWEGSICACKLTKGPWARASCTLYASILHVCLRETCTGARPSVLRSASPPPAARSLRPSAFAPRQPRSPTSLLGPSWQGVSDPWADPRATYLAADSSKEG